MKSALLLLCEVFGIVSVNGSSSPVQSFAVKETVTLPGDFPFHAVRSSFVMCLVLSLM